MMLEKKMRKMSYDEGRVESRLVSQVSVVWKIGIVFILYQLTA